MKFFITVLMISFGIIAGAASGSSVIEKYKAKIKKDNELGKIFLADMKNYSKQIKSKKSIWQRTKLKESKYASWPQMKFTLIKWNEEHRKLKNRRKMKSDIRTINKTIDNVQNLVRYNTVYVKSRYRKSLTEDIKKLIKENEAMQKKLNQLQSEIGRKLAVYDN